MKNNIQEYCRVCISKNAEMLSIFKDYKFSKCNLQIFEVITKCASVQIQKLDGFSERICKRCMEHLCQAFSFKQLCEESDHKFRHNLIHGLKIDSYSNELGGADEAINEERSCTLTDDESEFPEEDSKIQFEILQEENFKKPTTNFKTICNEESSCILTDDEFEIKSEFSEEDSKVQFGILQEENVKQATTNFTRLQNLSGLLVNLQKSKPLLFYNSEGSEFNANLERNTEQSPVTCMDVNSEIKKDNGTHNILDDIDIEIKSEFNAEEIKIQYGDFDTTQNLNDELSENMQNTDVSNKKLSIDGNCGQRFSEKTIFNEHEEELKTTSEFFEEDSKVQCGILQAGNVKKPTTNLKTLCNEERSCTLTDDEFEIKSEFSEEDSKVQFGILQEENVKKPTTNFTRLQNLSGLLENLQKSKPLLFSNSEGSEFNANLERNTEQSPISYTEVNSQIKEDNGTHNISDDVEIESEIYAEEGQIQYGDFDTTLNLNDELSENMQNSKVSNKNVDIDGICGQRFSENIILNEQEEEQKTTFGKHGISGPIKNIFICRSCGKSFSCYSHLVRHERFHTGEKSYQCETCNKCFKTLSCLKKHNMIHTGVKPYKCDICDKSYTRKKYLTSHMGIHRVCT